ncbi:hypothetical protein MRX96_007041 [Rhipicephalus microplus]
MASRYLQMGRRLERSILRSWHGPRLSRNEICTRIFTLNGAPPTLPPLYFFLEQWQLLCERPPKGFEKYFPGPKKTQQKEAGEQTGDKSPGKGKKHDLRDEMKQEH